jgi:hypothetical protein
MIEFVELPNDDPEETRESKTLSAKGRLQWRLMVLTVFSVATAIAWYHALSPARGMTRIFMLLMETLLFAIVTAVYLVLSIASVLDLTLFRKRQDNGPDSPHQGFLD